MNKITLMTAGAFLAAGASASANAAVLVGGTIDSLGDATGQPLTSVSKTMAIIDVDGDGLAGFDLANWDGSSFLPDPDDQIVTDTVGANGQWNEAANDSPAGLDFEDPNFGAQLGVVDVPTGKYQFDLVAPNSDSVVGAGDNVYLFWFPDLPLNAAAPGGGQSFGVLVLDDGTGDGLDPVGGLNVFQAFAGGPILPADGVTIPEPTSLALIGIGAALMLRRRRG